MNGAQIEPFQFV